MLNDSETLIDECVEGESFSRRTHVEYIWKSRRRMASPLIWRRGVYSFVHRQSLTKISALTRLFSISSEFISRITRRSSSAIGTLISNNHTHLLFLLLMSRICSQCFEQPSSTALRVVLLEVLAELHHLIHDGSHKTIAKQDANDDGQNNTIYCHRIELICTHPQTLPWESHPHKWSSQQPRRRRVWIEIACIYADKEEDNVRYFHVVLRGFIID